MDAVDGMVGNAFEHRAQIEFRIDARSAWGAEQSVDRGCTFSTGIGALNSSKSLVFGKVAGPEQANVSNLLKTPFFKHDGPEVEIAAAGNVRMGDKPDTMQLVTGASIAEATCLCPDGKTSGTARQDNPLLSTPLTHL